MDWDQIESKWVAMTRRVRGDVLTPNVDAIAKLPRRVSKVDAQTSLVADRSSAVIADQQTALSTQ